MVQRTAAALRSLKIADANVGVRMVGAFVERPL